MPPGLGPVHLLVIALVALIVLGPEKLPQVARQAGKAMGELRHWTQLAQDEMRNALDLDAEPGPDPAAPGPAVEPNDTPTPPTELDRDRSGRGSGATPAWVVTNWQHGEGAAHAEPAVAPYDGRGRQPEAQL